MALIEETKRLVTQFDYSDEDVNKGVKEFLRQMSKSMSSQKCLSYTTALMLTTIPDEGLEKEGTSMSQIPTYVTGVPNGTEKVCTLTA